MHRFDPMEKKSNLRVKTQLDSLLTDGLWTGEDDNSSVDDKKEVNFASLEVREFPLILGDNPGAREGPPITIDWSFDPNTQLHLDVNTYENMRTGARRSGDALVLPKKTREELLMKSGVSKREMAQCVRKVRRLKHHRMASSHAENFEPVNEAMEKVIKQLKRLFLHAAQSKDGRNYQRTLEDYIERRSAQVYGSYWSPSPSPMPEYVD